MSLRKPSAKSVASPVELAGVLGSFYDTLLPLSGKAISPDRLPALKAVTMASIYEMRLTRGDANGVTGPRACVVVGKFAILDGLGFEGLFAWDPTSRDGDDDVDVIESPAADVTAGAPGRWRRLKFGGRLLRVSVLAGSGSLAKEPGCNYAICDGWAAGGGGEAITAGSGFTAAGGGASGGYGRRVVPAANVPASWSWTGGAGGAGGIGGGVTAGVTGADFTFTDGAGTMTCHGGPGGGVSFISAGGAAPANSTGATIPGSGAPGDPGSINGATGQPIASGSGGSSQLGGGGVGIQSFGGSGPGNDARGFASGGGGALDTGGTNQNGGAGSATYGVLMEFS